MPISTYTSHAEGRSGIQHFLIEVSLTTLPPPQYNITILNTTYHKGIKVKQ